MIKEILLAITLGALLGFGATGAFVAVKKTKANPPVATNQSLDENNLQTTPIPPQTAPTTTDSSPTTPSPSPFPTTLPLEITQPENESVSPNSKVTLRGTSLPNTTIIVSTASKTYTATTSTSGKFNLDIELESGANFITVSAVDQEGNQTDSELVVTYSTSKF